MSRSADISPLARVVRRVDAVADGKAPDDSFSTGFASIDNVFSGGIRAGDLVFLGGEVGSGKSSLALAIALRMAQSGTVVTFLTHEMTVERVLERALAIEGRCRVDEMRAGTLSEASRAAVGAAALRLRDRAPVFATLPAGGTEVLGEALRRVPQVQVVLVDPLQALATGDGPLDEELARAVPALKRVALELNVAFVVTAHLQGTDAARADPRPTLGDFGALGAVKQHADAVLGIYREEMTHPGSGVDGATELLMLKNRSGRTGYVDLYFYKQWLRFEDMLDPAHQG